ncbi:MAG: sulfatase [Saprospiraceae bacterium]|nr:sulfatase [Saprospiraceae bacterium]
MTKFQLLFLLIFFSCRADLEPDRLPNILLIISDDQSWTDYGFMGHDNIETPNLDKLAMESMSFTRGYATAPLCSPSLASIISGLYAHQHGVTGNDPAFEFDQQRYSTEWRMTRQPFFEQMKENFYQNKLITKYLKEAGYRSLQTGKWWLGSWEEGHFDAGMTHGDPELGGRHGDDGLVIGREGLEEIFGFIKDSRQKEKPFFVWYAPFLPHTPHDPPGQLLNKYLAMAETESIARYWAMCEWFDQTCGELIDYINDQDLAEETLVIYTTDNGWIQDPDRQNRFAPRSKQSPYDMGIRTPFMLRWPGTIQPLIDTVNAVSNIDILPTILAAAGIQPNTEYQGINLMSEQARRTRTTVFAEDFAHDVDMEDPIKLLEHRIAIKGFWKLILPEGNDDLESEPELYNLAVDPFERYNLFEEIPEKAEELMIEIDRWWR